MGFRFRKSIKIGGGFRINLSKSGIGYSWGIKGLRLTKTAKGKNRATASIYGTGISFSTETGKKQVNFHSPAESSSQTNDVDYSNYDKIENINTRFSKDLLPKEYKAFLSSINKHRIFDFTLLAIAIAFLIIPPAEIICLILFIISRLCFRINLCYDFDDECAEKYNSYLNQWKNISKSRFIWNVTQTANVLNSKKLGNSNSAVNRKKTWISFRSPWWIKANVKFPVLNLINQRIILLPDKILVIKIGTGASPIQKANFDIYAIGYMEPEKLFLNDAELIKKQWVYTNKNGEPDKRFKNNIQLPVYKYGMIKASSESGLNFELMISKESVLDEFDKCLKDYISTFKKED